MVSQMFFYITLVSIFSLSPPLTPQLANSEEVPEPSFKCSWFNHKHKFEAGDIATITVKAVGKFDTHINKFEFNPNITVNNKMGNSSYVSGVSSNFEANFNSWNISFIPIKVGFFNVIITNGTSKVSVSPLHFRVNPGKMYPSAGVVSWRDRVDEFVAGKEAAILILPKDAFGNIVPQTSQGPNVDNFTVNVSDLNGSIANVLNVTNKGWNGHGYILIEFIAATAGNLLLHVQGNNQTLNGSPLSFKVQPGALDISNCVPQWNIETKSFQLFSRMETYIYQRDKYGNLVPGLYSFDVEVLEKGTNLSMPVEDLRFEEVVPGIQLFSFSLVEPGDFSLIIFDNHKNNLISRMPYDFSVYIGYCDGVNSIINGSGLNQSVAGEVARFSIFLKDAYQYPSPVELQRVQVKIMREFDSRHVQSGTELCRDERGRSCVQPNISATEIINGSWPTRRLNFGVSVDNFVRSSTFDVSYTPEKSGLYNICIFCGNIELNSGHPFKMEVRAGEVNTSISRVVKFQPKVPRLVRNEIVVQVMDSFSNPVLLQQSKLKIENAKIHKSGFSTSTFVDNKDGLYNASYLAEDTGFYEICASFDGISLFPCPFGVDVYSGKYFSKAYNDVVSVWEDESIAFDVLENDYLAHDNARIDQISKPDHGSLLNYGRLYRYTPYRGFYGNDSFMYNIADDNGNLASGVVNISVLSIPPQFVSFPNHLHVTEDEVSPRIGGFPSFGIIHSDFVENISVTISAQFGSVFLSPMLMQFWQPMWNELSVIKGDEKAEDLVIVGRLEVINFALQSIQYLGAENFYGDDTIRISTMNRNGENYLDIPIFVEPINDPPFIIVPEFIVLEEKRDEGLLIFDKQRDKFDVFVGDPDLLFLDNESQFLVMFSVEVTAGFLSTNLPAELINTTELKSKNNYQWQPLRTFVTISKHIMVKGKGIRFQGTVNDCNSIIQNLSYHGGEHGTVLTMTINDMGGYGCYPDCKELMSMPLFAEATVNLIRRRPMSSLIAHTLGSVIVIEFIFVFFLGTLLLFFMCKCAIVLVYDRRKHEAQSQDIELDRFRSSHKRTPNTDLSDNVTPFTCSRPSSLKPSNFRQRSRLKSGNGECSKDTVGSFQSSSDHRRETT